MGDEPLPVMSLPMTVTARRNARLRAAALATIPVILFVLAAIPRVWAPDLVPFEERQAAYVSESIRRAPISPASWYTDPSVPSLALVDPLLRDLPSPIAAWVVLRGILDAAGVALLYLAARPLLGVWPAILSAVLYGGNPYASAAARDPAGVLGAATTAAVLLAGVPLVRRRTWPRGALMALAVLLIAVPALLRLGVGPAGGWPGLLSKSVPDALTISFALCPFLLALPLASRRPGLRWGGLAGALLLALGAMGLVVTMTPRQPWQTPAATLRDWSTLAGEVRDAAARSRSGEAVVPGPHRSLVSGGELAALLRGEVGVRDVPADVVLPLERETVFVLQASERRAIELGRPASQLSVSTPDAPGTTASIVTLRPRPAADWLARVERVENGGYADGSRLLGVTATNGGDGTLNLSLYWSLPTAAGSQAGTHLMVELAGAPRASAATLTLTPVEDRRSDEIAVHAVRLTPPPGWQGTGSLQVTLYAGNGTIVRTAAGGVSLDVPLGSAPR